MDAYNILVIILSVCLAIFLVLGIMVLIYLLKLIKNLKDISDKANAMVSNASDLAATLSKAAAPAAVARFVIDTVQRAVSNRNSSKK